MTPIYLDNNATTRPADEVVAAVADALRERWHNPSSVHRPGQAARQAVELAREAVAELLGCRDRQVVFTSGGTESVNLAVLGSLARDPKRPVFVTTRLEHVAVRDTAEFVAARDHEIVWLALDDDGRVDLAAFDELLQHRASEIGIVSVMWSNNETGLIQPIEAIGTRCREHGVRFHTDAVQWVGRMPMRVADLPVDLLSFSAHKFHGPKGVGGLYVRRGIRVEPRNIGGPQEMDRRAGTENVPGIVGMGVAARCAIEWLATDERTRLEALRDRLEQGIVESVDDAVVNGGGAPRIWNTTNIAFPRLEAEAILLLLSERGVCASAGAACSSGSLDPSPVLLAMGIEPTRAHGSIRLSLSRETTTHEIDDAIETLTTVLKRIRRST